VSEKVTVEVVDDLDGSRGDDVDTVRFGLDGVEFEIDLCPANAARLRELLWRYARCARLVLREAEPAPAESRPSPVRSHDAAELRAVRAWARAQGFSVPNRGRLSEAVLRAYETAHPESRPSAWTRRGKLWN
jgi:hypothetical protein